ncbi:lipid transferase CIDEA isoform 2-T2 [Callospermophilus lateralis]|uniref:lipid transferase CIDEA isoform X2 n=1 Tax=Callospermophilus lateralis TaxID=76772 RepID=UPI0040543A1F
MCPAFPRLLSSCFPVFPAAAIPRPDPMAPMMPTGPSRPGSPPPAGSAGARPLTFMGSQTKKVLLTPLMHPARPFRVSNHDRSSRRGVMASSLKELISKTLDALVITAGLVTLVLEEDGTVVDSEEFFQTLGDNTHFMILEKGQKWTQGAKYGLVGRQPKKSGIARVTFDLYKLNPKDFLGCLNVKATMYEMYSVSYDIRCTGLKAMLSLLSHWDHLRGHRILLYGVCCGSCPTPPR